tara:strand:+ start:7 stop:321 length:315 start_codon:yes stop_codon:yes gene_type:complete
MKLEELDLKKKLDLELSHWSLTSNGEILRVIERKEVQGIYFGAIIESIWSLAEVINHHPDILLQYNEIKITLVTHDEAGVTLKDIEMAKKIDSLLERFFKISKI